MKKLFVCQGSEYNPCIKEEAINKLISMNPELEFEVVLQDDIACGDKNSLNYLANSLEELMSSNFVYFGKGWDSSTLSQLLHHDANKYHIEIIND